MATYYPQDRAARYPRHLRVDLKKLKHETLVRYIKTYGVHVRPDCTPGELQVAVGRHFEAHLDADDEESVARFVLAVKRQGTSGVGGKRGDRSRGPGAIATTKKRRAAATKPSHLDDFEGDGEGDDDPTAPNTYCTCKRPDYGEMIACDNEDCEIEWFHLGCVNLTPSTRPGDDEQWFCLDCRAPDSPAIGRKIKPKPRTVGAPGGGLVRKRKPLARGRGGAAAAGR